MPISHIISAQSRGSPVIGIQFELSVIGYLQLDTHMICTSVMCALMASVAMFPHFSKLMKSATDIFAEKKSSKDI